MKTINSCGCIKGIQEPIFYLLGIGFIFILWWVGHEVTPQKIPSIGTVFELLIDNSDTNKVNDVNSPYNGWNKNLVRLTESGIHAFGGLLWACIISFAIVLIISLMPDFSFFVTPLTLFVQITPIVALVPLFMILFNLQDSYIVSSVAVSFFPLYNAGIDGFKRVPDKMLNLAKIYHTNRWNQFWYFKQGYVIESMLSALKVSATLSMVGALVGEYVIGGEYSLGVFISNNSSSHLYKDSRFVAIILALLVGTIFYFGGFIIHKIYANYIRIEKA